MVQIDIIAALAHMDEIKSIITADKIFQFLLGIIIFQSNTLGISQKIFEIRLADYTSVIRDINGEGIGIGLGYFRIF